MWLRDTGVLEKMKEDELSAPIPIPDPKIRAADERISLEQLGISIVIYSSLMVLSLLCFIGELSTKGRVARAEKKLLQPRKSIQKHQYQDKGNNTGQDIIMPRKITLTKISTTRYQTPPGQIKPGGGLTRPH